jgi:hypothetical protein
MKRIRHATLELVDAIWNLFFCDGALDVTILASVGAGAQWDMLHPLLPQHCAREGTGMLLNRIRVRFVRRYASWQRLAVRNGRFFPAPIRWEVTLNTQGSVQVVLGWAAGFTPGDQVLVVRRVAEVFPGQVSLAHQAPTVIQWLA